MLQIRYRRTVGDVSLNGNASRDNVAHTTPWEIGLRCVEHRSLARDIERLIMRLNEGHIVMSDSALAAQQTSERHHRAARCAMEALAQDQVRVARTQPVPRETTLQ